MFALSTRNRLVSVFTEYNYVGDVLQALKINPFPYIPINSLTHTFMQCQLSIFHLDVQYELELFRELQDIDKDFFW